MFALKTEVLGQSGTTAATDLTSFIYLKYQNKKNIHKMKNASKKARFEGKDRVVVIGKSRYNIARDGEGDFCCTKCYGRRTAF